MNHDLKWMREYRGTVVALNPQFIVLFSRFGVIVSQNFFIYTVFSLVYKMKSPNYPNRK